MKSFKTYKIIGLAIISVIAVVLGYDLAGLMLGYSMSFFIVLIGAFSGYWAMKVSSNLVAKCLIGVPTALNSIVLLYLCSPLVIFLVEVAENA